MTIVVRPYKNNLFRTLRGAEVISCNYQQKWLFVQYINAFYVLDINELLHQTKTSSFIMMRTLHSTPPHSILLHFGWISSQTNSILISSSLPTHLLPVLIGYTMYCIWRVRDEKRRNKKNIKELPVDFLFTFRSFSFPFSSVFSIFFLLPILNRSIVNDSIKIIKKLIKRINCIKWDEVDHTQQQQQQKRREENTKATAALPPFLISKIIMWIFTQSV